MAEWAMRPVGYVRSPFTETSQVPKGLGVKHATEGVIEILSEFEPGLKDVEGFSHLTVIGYFTEPKGMTSLECRRLTLDLTAYLPHTRRAGPIPLG